MKLSQSSFVQFASPFNILTYQAVNLRIVAQYDARFYWHGYCKFDHQYVSLFRQKENLRVISIDVCRNHDLPHLGKRPISWIDPRIAELRFSKFADMNKKIFYFPKGMFQNKLWAKWSMKVRKKNENIRNFNIIVVFSYSEKRYAPSLQFDNKLLRTLFFALHRASLALTYNMC